MRQSVSDFRVIIENEVKRQKNGANERNRTADLFITSELLYRLSYIGTDLCHDTLTISHMREKGKQILKKNRKFSRFKVACYLFQCYISR